MSGSICAIAGMSIPPSGLYSFTDATFTPGTQTGSTGPNLTTARNGLTGTGVDAWKNDTSFFNVVTQGIQLWKVPATKTYRIEATGARGGSSGFGPGGYGARIITDVTLTEGQILAIVVGQSGEDNAFANNFTSGPGGGGGTFIYDNSSITYYVAVGGGGGALTSSTNLTSTQSDAHGKANTTSGTSITDAGGFISLGGTSGNGGGISSRNVLYGGAGAGILSAGAAGNGSYPGQSRTGNWLGGALTYQGGFGGGGSSYGESGYTQYKWGGGGGGYSGGACGHNGGNSDGQYGGGGGSYNIGSLQTATNGFRNGPGYVTITAL